MLNKHAYLLIAHNNFGVLEKLIKMLDYKHKVERILYYVR